MGERTGTNPEVLRNVGTRDNSRSEHVQNRQNDDQTNHIAYDSEVLVSEAKSVCTSVTFQLVFRTKFIESENPIESLSNHDILTDVLI